MAEDRNVPLTVLEVEVSDGEAALEVPRVKSLFVPASATLISTGTPAAKIPAGFGDQKQ